MCGHCESERMHKVVCRGRRRCPWPGQDERDDESISSSADMSWEGLLWVMSLDSEARTVGIAVSGETADVASMAVGRF